MVRAFTATWGGSLLSSLKILLFLSNQIFQHRNLGVHIHASLRRFLLLRLKGESESQLLMNSITEFGSLSATEPIIILQTSLVNSQLMKRCSGVSSVWLHREQREGPSQPFLLRLSLVIMLLWRRVHIKISILGIEGNFHRVFHGAGLGGTQGVFKMAA